MDEETYTAWLKERLEGAFDFEDPVCFPGLPLTLWAVCNRRSEKFFFTRKINLYAVETDAYVLLYHVRTPLTAELLKSCCEAVQQYLKKCFKVRATHMSSLFTLVVTAPAVPAEACAAAEKVAYHKDFMFTLRGWADLALVAVDLTSGEVCCNAMGRRQAPLYTWL